MNTRNNWIKAAPETKDPNRRSRKSVENIGVKSVLVMDGRHSTRMTAILVTFSA